MKKKKTKLAIFDVDGTIFRKNLHFELLDELVYQGVFSKIVRRELVNVYGQWLNNEGTYEVYRNKLVSLYGKHIKGCSQADVLKASQKVASFNAKRIYVFSRDLILKLKEDHTLLMISGSPIEIVKEYAVILNFDFYFGSIYEINKSGNYTGQVSFEPVEDKGQVIRKYVVENNFSLKDSFGVGDTESDASFLYLVEHPIAFNPNLNLKKIAQKNKWDIVVEKKDVIYNF